MSHYGTQLLLWTLYSEEFWHAVIIIDPIIIASHSGTRAVIIIYFIASHFDMQLSWTP